MAGFESPNYTQVPNDLFEMMGDMTDAELKITLALARLTFGYHRETVDASIATLCKMTGLSYNSAVAGARRAEERGLIRRTQNGLSTSNWEVVINIPQKVKVNPSNSEGLSLKNCRINPSNSEGQVGLNKEIKIKQNTESEPNAKPDIIDAMLLAGGKERDDSFPVDVQGVINEFAKTWRTRPPARAKDRAKWVSDARELVHRCGGEAKAARAVAVARQKYEDYQRTHNGLGPFTYGDIGSIIKYTAQIAGTMTETQAEGEFVGGYV